MTTYNWQQPDWTRFQHDLSNMHDALFVIAEKALSQAMKADKKSYYTALKTASRSNEVTAWVKYFVSVILCAQINFILHKSVFFQAYKSALNARQLKVVERMMQAGIKGYEGGMSAKKYMAITGTSKATATRGLKDLLEMRAFKQRGSGRNVRYELNLS